MNTSNPWFARIREGLFKDPSGKHRKKMGEAIWLYGYLHICVDLETGQTVRKYKTISNETGIPESSVKKMMLKLKRAEYIKTTRLGQGLVVQITKWEPVKKKTRRTKSSLSKAGEIDHIRTADGPYPARWTTDGLSPSGLNDKEKSTRETTDGLTNEIRGMKSTIADHLQ